MNAMYWYSVKYATSSEISIRSNEIFSLKLVEKLRLKSNST